MPLYPPSELPVLNKVDHRISSVVVLGEKKMFQKNKEKSCESFGSPQLTELCCDGYIKAGQ